MTRAAPPFGPDDAQITILVMDPLAEPLACDCVQGYAQRRYEVLAQHLSKTTGKTFRVVWAESLEVAQRDQPGSQFDLIIGKDSVVRHQTQAVKLEYRPLASLTDTQGLTTQKGLFVATKNSSAASLLDLEGCEILFGPADCDEKSSQPLQELEEIEITFRTGDICSSCSVAAKQLLEAENQDQMAAVISSYAAPLLEGCGTIKKGDLRIVGETQPIPFITAFFGQQLDTDIAASIQQHLLELKNYPLLLKALETRYGFVEYQNARNSEEHSNLLSETTDEPSKKKCPASQIAP